jgi:hypothetical protein
MRNNNKNQESLPLQQYYPLLHLCTLFWLCAFFNPLQFVQLWHLASISILPRVNHDPLTRYSPYSYRTNGNPHTRCRSCLAASQSRCIEAVVLLMIRTAVAFVAVVAVVAAVAVYTAITGATWMAARAVWIWLVVCEDNKWWAGVSALEEIYPMRVVRE